MATEPSHARERRWPVDFEVNVNSRRPVMRVVTRLTLSYVQPVTDERHSSRITKRNWDRLLLPIVIVSAACAALLGVLANYWDTFTLPAFTLAGWFYFRCTTPPSGRKAVSINGNPKVKALLGWLTFMLVLTGICAFVDALLLKNSLSDPIGAPQVILFIAMIALLLTGVFVIERRFPTARTRPRGGG